MRASIALTMAMTRERERKDGHIQVGARGYLVDGGERVFGYASVEMEVIA